MIDYPLRIKEAAERLSFSRAHLYVMARRGDIQIKKIGGRAIILASEIDRLLRDAPILSVTGKSEHGERRKKTGRSQ